MKLSLVIPGSNEAGTIRLIGARGRAVPVPDKAIIIVDDCSRARTLIHAPESSAARI